MDNGENSRWTSNRVSSRGDASSRTRIQMISRHLAASLISERVRGQDSRDLIVMEGQLRSLNVALESNEHVVSKLVSIDLGFLQRERSSLSSAKVAGKNIERQKILPSSDLRHSIREDTRVRWSLESRGKIKRARFTGL